VEEGDDEVGNGGVTLHELEILWNFSGLQRETRARKKLKWGEGKEGGAEGNPYYG